MADPNYQDPFGNTLLHVAVISGDLDEVELLLAAGADPRIANRDGKTPLHAALIFEQPAIYDRLRQARGVSRGERFPKSPIQGLAIRRRYFSR